MVLGISHDLDASAVSQHIIAFRNSVTRVVRTLGLNVGMQFADKAADIRLLEDNDGIDVGQSRNDLGALFGWHERTSLTLELPDAGIGVHGHDQPSTQRFCAAKIAHVPNMQQVEATVGQHDLLALVLPLGDLGMQVETRKYLGCVFAHVLFVAAYWSMADISSWFDAVAVPRFITTIPPAKFASCAAVAVSAPAASAAVKVAITVSPAPVTSTTWSDPKIGIVSGATFFSNATMPSRPRVMTSDSNPMRCMT